MRMAGLIDNVLDFARGRLGGGIMLERNADEPLEPILHQVIDELRLASPGRQIHAELQLASRSIATGAELGNWSQIWLGMRLATAQLTSPFAFALQPRTDNLNCRSQTVGSQFLRLP